MVLVGLIHPSEWKKFSKINLQASGTQNFSRTTALSIVLQQNENWIEQNQDKYMEEASFQRFGTYAGNALIF